MRARHLIISRDSLLISLAVLGWLLGSAAGAWASSEGQHLADHVGVDGYFHLMDDLLYTKSGDNRGFGVQHDLARNNIEQYFLDLGLDVELDPFPYGSGTYYNVVATLPGSIYPDEILIIGAHYDSVNNPGADDDASGVAGIMTAAWILAQGEWERTTRFIAFDREEQGLIGSGAYVSDYYEDNIIGMVELDMIAFNTDDGDTAEIVGRATSNAIKTALADAVEEYGPLNVLITGQADYSDHAPFEHAGFQATLLIEDWGNPYYHTSQDRSDRADYLDWDYAVKMTRAVVGMFGDHAGLIRLPCWGDMNFDHVVNVSDFSLFVGSYGASRFDPDYNPYADMNNDGVVNLTDFTRFVTQYGQPCP